MEKSSAEYNQYADKLVANMFNKGYSRNSAQIICTISNSEQAHRLKPEPIERIKLVIEQVEKYDDEKDCINSLIEIIK